MRKLLKWLFRLALFCLLLLCLVALSLPWWGPPVVERISKKVLAEAGFSEVDFSLEAIGTEASTISVKRLRYPGVELSDAGLRLHYDLLALLRGELESVVLESPVVDLHLTEILKSIADRAATEDTESPDDKLPVDAATIHAAQLTVREEDWSQTVQVDGQFAAEERPQARIALRSVDLVIEGQAEMLWPHPDGRVSASIEMKDPMVWLSRARQRDWLALPDAYALQMGPLKSGLSAQLVQDEAGEWEARAQLERVGVSMAEKGVTAAGLALDIRGEGMEPEGFEFTLSQGTANHPSMALAFDQFTAQSAGAEQVMMRLVGWGVEGESPDERLGPVSLSAPDLELRLDGPWQVWEPGFAPERMSGRVKMESGSLSFFSRMGSAAGTLQMEATLSTGSARELQLTANLQEADLMSSGVGLEAEALGVSVRGAFPDALEATLRLSQGDLTWSEAAGSMTGLRGTVRMSSILPPVTAGSQMLEFDSMQQGDFSMDTGRVRLSYQGTADVASPLKLEFNANALGGRVRLLVEGQLSSPLSLGLRMQMEGVELAQLAALFPQFEGEITGKASGEMAFRLEDKRLVLLPGGLRLTPETTGRFKYTRQGWLTQDADLNPEVFVKDREIVDIMHDPKGASVITELAMRDLAMSEFTLRLLDEKSGDVRVKAQIKGSSLVKGIEVPVVLDVPIRGDVKEAINAVLKFNARR